MGDVVVIGAGFGGRYVANALEAPCISRSNGFDINSNLEGVLREIRNYKPKYILNFASQSMVGESWLKPSDWMQTNVVGQTKLIQSVAKFDFLTKYIHFTTPEVYGSTSTWMKENWSFSPSTPYAASRAAGDWITKMWCEQYGFPAVFTRAANIYGEGQQFYRVIPKTVLFGLTGRKLPLHGGGKSIRAFVHMDDVCESLKILMERGEIGECYHVSPHAYLSIRELIGLIEQLIGVSGIAEISNDRPGKDQAYLLDSSKIMSMGWTPKVNLDDGIRRVEAWVRSNLDRFSRAPTDYQHLR